METKQARLWLRQHMLPSEGQELQELGMKHWEWRDTVAWEGSQRPSFAQAMHATWGWQAVVGEIGFQVASECLLFPDYFMEKSHLIIISDLPFYSHRRAPISQKLCVLFSVVSLYCPKPWHWKLSQPFFLVVTKRLDGSFLYNAGPRVWDFRSFGESLFSTGLTLLPASRLFFYYQKGNKNIIASWANRPRFPQDYLSFGFIESFEQ